MIFSYEELRDQLIDTEDCMNGCNFDGERLLENYAAVLKSHIKLQDRNEKLRKANSSLVDIIKGVRAALGSR